MGRGLTDNEEMNDLEEPSRCKLFELGISVILRGEIVELSLDGVT